MPNNKSSKYICL